MKLTSIKGMHDVGPPEIGLWHHVEKTARQVLEAAFFSELRTPVLEEEALFTRGLGNTTEVVEKEMYAFADRDEKRLALRPEGTASIVRSFIEHFATPGGSHRRFYYMGPMFRRERPQKGRYRQFHQIGAEVFESTHPYTDAELIHLADEIFRRLNIQGVKLQLNSLGCKSCRPIFKENLLQFLKPLAATLCADCQRRLEHNPLRVIDCKKEVCIAATQAAPSALDFLCGDCSVHFEGVQQGLKAFSTPYTINPRMVRGLDYYERTAFEFLSGELGAQNAVAGGGRYDDLVKELGGPAICGVGFAIGLERLVSLVSTSPINFKSPLKIYFAGLGEEARVRLLPIMLVLRREGFCVLSAFDAQTFKAMLRQADRLNADETVIVGEDELKQGVAQIKNMKTGEQKNVSLNTLVDYFKGSLLSSTQS